MQAREAQPASARLRTNCPSPAKSLQIYWEGHGRLENYESSRLSTAELFQQIIIHDHFSHAPVRQAADEPGTA
jgi:hypothetical protein